MVHKAHTSIKHKLQKAKKQVHKFQQTDPYQGKH